MAEAINAVLLIVQIVVVLAIPLVMLCGLIDEHLDHTFDDDAEIFRD